MAHIRQNKQPFAKEFVLLLYSIAASTTVSQDVQTRFPVQLASAKFLSKIKGNFYFWGSAVSMILECTVLKISP